MLPEVRDEQIVRFNPIKWVIMVTIVIVMALTLLLAYSSAKKTGRDAQRVSDITFLQKALQYYYEEYGAYPQGSSKYEAIGTGGNFSRFISPWPVPPKPADGKCTEDANTYQYQQTKDGTSYELKFCLGGSHDDFKAGVTTVTPEE